MKKIFAILLSVVMLLAFAACAGTGDAETNSTAETQTQLKKEFIFNGTHKVTVTKEEVVFDDYYNKDTFMLYYTIENISQKALSFSEANINAHQNGDYLSPGQLTDENDNFICTFEKADETLEPGKTADLIFGWQLIDDRPVTVIFGGYTDAVEKIELTFDVEMTDEAKAYNEKVAKELEEKKNAAEISLPGCDIVRVDGWYFDSVEDDRCTLNLEGDSAYIDVVCSSFATDAKEEANRISGNFTENNTVTEKDIGGTHYYVIEPSSSMFLLFAPYGNNEGTVEITGMFCSLESCLAQLKNIKVK